MASKTSSDSANSKKRTEAATDRLEEIKAAAVELFYERGYHGTDLRSIASHVGLHPSTFYNYIDSKQEILFLILEEAIEGVTVGLSVTLDEVSEADVVERLRRAVAFHVTWCATKRFSSWTQIVELPTLESPYRERLVARRDEYQSRWVGLLDEGIEANVFSPSNTQMVAFGLLGMMSSVARWYRPTGDSTVEEIVDLIVQMVVDGLLPGELLGFVGDSKG